MLFSLKRKAPKDSPRLPSRTLMLLLGSVYPRLERCCSARKARTGPAGARRAPYERLPERCLRKWRRPADHANEASVDAVFYSRHRTAASRTDGQAVRLQLLFVLFLSVQEKDTFLLCQRRKIRAFLTEEKSTKRLTETSVSDSHASAGKRIPTAPNSCLLSLCSASQHSPCGK